MSTWVWVLTFTMLGNPTEHGTMAKFETRGACEEHLTILKQEARNKKRQLVGHCHLVLRKSAADK